MKTRVTLLAIALMMLAFSAGCGSNNPDYDALTGGGQCPEGTAPVTVVTLDGETVIECLPVALEE